MGGRSVGADIQLGDATSSAMVGGMDHWQRQHRNSAPLSEGILRHGQRGSEAAHFSK